MSGYRSSRLLLMTDTDRMVAWLREAMGAAQHDAEGAGGDKWRRQDHPSDTIAIYDSKGEPVVYDEGSPTEEQQAHIVRNSPAAVLRRIAADRRMFERHWPRETLAIVEAPNKASRVVICDHDRQPWPCPDITDLAESWGWTEDIHEAETRSYTEVAEALKGSLRRIVDTMPTGHPVANFLEASADWIGRRPLYYHGRADRPAVSGGCYEASWGWVHVKPGCHCPR